MSAGSAASNLGYAKIIPNSNINGNFVNKDNSHYPGGFGSNETSSFFGLAGAKSNIDAAASTVPGICMSGGGKNLKNKIKNITKRYKMSKKSIKKRISGIKRKFKASLSKAMNRTQSLAKSRSLSRSIARTRSIAGGRRTKRKGGNPFAAFRAFKFGKKMYDKKYNPKPVEQVVDQQPIDQTNSQQMGGYSQYQNNMPMTPTYSTGGVLSPTNSALANPVPYKLLPNETNNIDNYNHFTNSGFPSRGH